jgi:hypothetical protein
MTTKYKTMAEKMIKEGLVEEENTLPSENELTEFI